MQSKTFSIYAVNTQDEVDRIVSAVAGLPGVQQFQGDRSTKLFTITWDKPATLEDVGNMIQGLGYTPAMK
jgi:copper chaperone CopZ